MCNICGKNWIWLDLMRRSAMRTWGALVFGLLTMACGLGTEPARMLQGEFAVELIDGQPLPFTLGRAEFPEGPVTSLIVSHVMELDGAGVAVHHIVEGETGTRNGVPFYDEDEGSVSGTYQMTGRCAIEVRDPYWPDVAGRQEGEVLTLTSSAHPDVPARTWKLRQVSGRRIC